MTNTLSVSGNITLASGMTIAGASTLIVNTASTLTSNGKVWSPALTFSVSSTKTLADNWVVTGLFTSLTTTQTLAGGGTLTCNGGITATGNIASSTSTIILGSGTWSGAAAVNCNLTFSGSSTISGGILLGGTNTPILAYSSGTITTASSTLNLSSCFINANPITFNNVTLGVSAAVYTLNNAFNIAGTLSSGAATTTMINGQPINASGSVTIGTNWSGTTTLNYTGNGTFGGALSTSILNNNTNINTTGATFTSFNYRTNTLTWNQIGSSNFGSMTLIVNTSNPIMTVNVSGLTLPTFQAGGATNITLNGTNGFTMQNYLCASGTVSKETWLTGVTYTITSGISINTTLALANVWVSSNPGTRYNMVLAQGATCDVLFANFTDVDGSLGRTGWNNKGTLSNCLNWSILPTSPSMISSPF